MGVVADIDVTFNIQSYSGAKSSCYQTIIICFRRFTVCIQISIIEVECIKIIVNCWVRDVQSENIAIYPIMTSIIATVGPDVITVSDLIGSNHTVNIWVRNIQSISGICSIVVIQIISRNYTINGIATKYSIKITISRMVVYIATIRQIVVISFSIVAPIE